MPSSITTPIPDLYHTLRALIALGMFILLVVMAVREVQILAELRRLRSLIPGAPPPAASLTPEEERSLQGVQPTLQVPEPAPRVP